MVREDKSVPTLGRERGIQAAFENVNGNVVPMRMHN